MRSSTLSGFSGVALMNMGELSWVAGFLEGEGWFSYSETTHERYGQYRYPRVACSSTDLDMLERLRKYSKVGQITGPRRLDDETRKPSWDWVVSKTRDAVMLMEAIYPYMGERRQAKIDEILDFVGRHKRIRRGDRETVHRRMWVAGYLEGEGSFFLPPFRYQMESGEYGPYYYPRVSAGSTDQDVIELLHRYTGVGQITGPYPRGEDRKDATFWTISALEDAIAFMKAIRSYMGQRRRAKIEEILDFLAGGRGRGLSRPPGIRLDRTKLPPTDTTITDATT